MGYSLLLGTVAEKKIRKKFGLVLNPPRMPFIFCPFRLAKFGQIMTIKNFVLIIFFGKFFFGVKFVSANIDAFFNKKNGGQIFSPKKDQTGGEGGLAKDHTFSGFFFRHTPLSYILESGPPILLLRKSGREWPRSGLSVTRIPGK